MERRKLCSLLLALCDMATAIPWMGPVQTSASPPAPSLVNDATIPRHTAPPLFERAISTTSHLSTIFDSKTTRSRGHNTWGFVDGDYEHPVYCRETAATCVYQHPAGLFDCCIAPPNCGDDYKTTCVDDTKTCDDACQENKNVLKCTGSKVYCMVVTLDDRSHWDCGPSQVSTSISNMWSTWKGASASDVNPILTVTDWRLLSSLTKSGAASPSSTSTTSTTPSTSAATVPDSKTLLVPRTPSNVGAIAGGVVGAVAVLGLFALAFYYIRSQRRGAGAGAGGTVESTDATASTGLYEIGPGEATALKKGPPGGVYAHVYHNAGVGELDEASLHPPVHSELDVTSVRRLSEEVELELEAQVPAQGPLSS